MFEKLNNIQETEKGNEMFKGVPNSWN